MILPAVPLAVMIGRLTSHQRSCIGSPTAMSKARPSRSKLVTENQSSLPSVGSLVVEGRYSWLCCEGLLHGLNQITIQTTTMTDPADGGVR